MPKSCAYVKIVTQILYLTSHTTGIPTHMLSTSSELDYRYICATRKLYSG